MSRFSFHKLIGLTILYAVIIVGIFAFQFRNQSIFSKNFSNLKLTLSQNDDENKAEKPFDDTFTVSFKGLTLFSNQDNKPMLVTANGRISELQFINWKQLSQNSFRLNFSQNVSATFSIVGENNDCLIVDANLPQNCSLSIPYKFSKSYSVTDSSEQKLTLKSNNTFTNLTANQIEPNQIVLNSENNQARYFNFKQSKQFTFDSILENPLAQTQIYQENVQKIRDVCMNQFDSLVDNLTEDAVNAYLAEMSEKNRYLEAIAKIPNSYKNDVRRTYITAPYLNNLVKMNSSLSMHMENLAYKMNFSLENANLGIFESEDVASFLLTQTDEKIRTTLALPAKLSNFSPTINQAAGILTTYTQLKASYPDYANLLEPVLQDCVRKIESCCSLNSDFLYLSQNSEQLDKLTSISVGKALIDFGNCQANPTYVAAGNFIVNSQISENDSAQTCTKIYSILMKENTFLPHLQIVNRNSDKTIWAWTAAQEIKYSKDENGTITFATKFPQGASHYMILKNIEPFQTIEIYELKFRTDPRFESYNSSGYIYDAASKTLFLKFRHRRNTENVRLFYKQAEEEKVEKPEVAPSVSETSTSTQNTQSTIEETQISAQQTDTNSTVETQTTAVESVESAKNENAPKIEEVKPSSKKSKSKKK